ncbi:hypothetical protein BGZ60DRAFT_561932 [Tricladium varicosporioides]|nr:hypothetical protein BGZ60DRAFT_561932 [Hymenoscyphus varicosporioides]
MPPLAGFSDNPLESRDDVLRAAVSFLSPLQPYKSSCYARIKLSTSTGTGFDEISAQLEGFARPLWVVADLLAQNDLGFSHLDLSSWVLGLGAGTDPREELYWGDVGDHDQRMVEMEPIAYALLTAPSVFLPKSQQKRDMIMRWLQAINERIVPPSNWRWFRILVNLALVKSFGVPYSEVKPLLDMDFEVLDSFYLSDGWSSDGLWCGDKKQADYYSGSFAIQYSQLAFVRFASDLDPERADRYRSEAGKFAETFWRYFDVEGAAIPFGRSLSYRFTFAAFWSAVVVADVPLAAPLNNLGVVKGLLMRHLRWWTRKSDIFNTDGTLAIGYTYPNMYMSEDYNSPQSLYWCLKTFSVLGLDKNHPFWTCEELSHPLSFTRKPELRQDLRSQNILGTPQPQSQTPDTIAAINPAVQVTCGAREHHFLLSAGQFTRKTHRAREAKYGKFAYSSAFAFSVPAGTLLSQMAPDSTLSISNDNGETWRARWEPIAARILSVKLSIGGLGEHTLGTAVSLALISGWQPWKFSDLQIDTILVPPLERWPGWHVRIHKLTWKSRQMSGTVDLVDAGFAISSQGIKGGVLPHLDEELRHYDASKREHEGEVAQEGIWEGNSASLILSEAGASGVADLTCNTEEVSTLKEVVKHTYQGYILKPDANTNLVAQRSLIPTIYHNFDASHQESGDVRFITGIFAVAASAKLDPARIREMWRNRPNITLHEWVNFTCD